MILSIESRETKDYGTILDVWYVGGKHRLVKRPFDPYFYSVVRKPNYQNEEKQLTDLAMFQAMCLNCSTYELKLNLRIVRCSKSRRKNESSETSLKKNFIFLFLVVNLQIARACRW
jgi:hypothetical protein